MNYRTLTLAFNPAEAGNVHHISGLYCLAGDWLLNRRLLLKALGFRAFVEPCPPFFIYSVDLEPLPKMPKPPALRAVVIEPGHLWPRLFLLLRLFCGKSAPKPTKLLQMGTVLL